MKMLRDWRFWLGMIISIICLWLALRNVPFDRLYDSFKRADYVWLIAAVAIQVLAVYARGLRWRVLLRFKGAPSIYFWAQSVGYLFINVLPLRVGELARVAVISDQCGIPFVHVGASAIVERIIDVATVLLVLVLILPSMHVPLEVINVGRTFGVLVLAALVFLILIVRMRTISLRLFRSIAKKFTFLHLNALFPRWEELLDGFEPITQIWIALQAVFWSAISWICSIGLYWIVLRAFHPQAELFEAAFMVVALSLALTVPSSPGYIGVFQFIGQQALVLPFGNKYDASLALAITLTVYFIYYFVTSALGLIGLWRTGKSFSNILGFLQKRQSDRQPPISK